MRERRDEILPLARRFLATAVQELGLARPVAITPAAEALLVSAPWRYNVRDLRNVCCFALLEARGSSEIGPEHLPEDIGGCVAPYEGRAPRDYTDDELLTALSTEGGIQKRAAERLGMSPRHLGRMLVERGLRSMARA